MLTSRRDEGLEGIVERTARIPFIHPERQGHRLDLLGQCYRRHSVYFWCSRLLHNFALQLPLDINPKLSKTCCDCLLPTLLPNTIAYRQLPPHDSPMHQLFGYGNGLRARSYRLDHRLSGPSERGK